METCRPSTHIAPMTENDLLDLQNTCPAEDRRPFGKVTPSSRSFWIERSETGTSDVLLHASAEIRDAFEIKTDSILHFGLPVQERIEGAVKDSSRIRRLFSSNPAFVPRGIPIAYHPKIAAGESRLIGKSAGRGKVLLASDPHVTIINGESRSTVYPDAYPYTAICKLHVESQAMPGGAWGNRRHATGFLVGRRTIMTSGHVHPDLSAHAWRIQVIPACWAGRSLFGMGYITYVRTVRWWHSDSGNDIMVGELYDAIGDDIGYFGSVVYDSDWQDRRVWTMSGYHYDRSLWAPSVQRWISVRDDDDGDNIILDGEDYDTTQVESDADEASGASGSPLFAWFDGDARAVGVHSGVQRDETITGTEILSCAAGGVGFNQVVAWARSAWG